jgi:UDP-2-acetamido-3-amino-2,3-dideoxy-glucuronate N-acetyltransferase
VNEAKVAPSAEIESDVSLGASVQIWHRSHLRTGVIIGDNTVVGENVYIDIGVSVGKNSKIQNNALIYHPANLAEGVFIGPSVILTNDRYPRAINLNETKKTDKDWIAAGVNLEKGVSIGAGAICIGPIRIQKWAMIAAGAVVTHDVNAYALVAGVPAKQIGWVGKYGVPLIKVSQNSYQCPVIGTTYTEKNGILEEYFVQKDNSDF